MGHQGSSHYGEGIPVTHLNVFFICGMLSPLFYIAMTIVGGVITPDYSHVYHAVSELMQRGAPHKALMDGFLILSNISNLLFGLGVFLFFYQTNRYNKTGFAGVISLFLIGLIGILITLFFPMDPRDSQLTTPGLMHLILVSILAILSLATPILFGLSLWKESAFLKFAKYSFISAIVILVTGGLAAAAALTPSPYMGLAERVTIGMNMQWMFIFAWTMYRFNAGNK